MNAKPKPGSSSGTSGSGTAAEGSSRKRFIFGAGGAAVLVIGLAFYVGRPTPPPMPVPDGGDHPVSEAEVGSRGAGGASRVTGDPGAVRLASAGRSPEQTVAAKVARFAQNRLGIAEAMAQRFGVTMTAETRRFFEAVESGDWSGAQALYQGLKAQMGSDARPKALEALWGPVVETFGVAEVSRKWPARELLDYGNLVLSSLKPNAVYFGGSDAGRFVPALLSEGGGGAQPLVLTQNSLADRTYLEYIAFQHGQRLAVPSDEETSKVFQDYVGQAAARALMDRQQRSGDAGARLLPGEEVTLADGKVSVGGQTSVMAINEGIIRGMMEKNPDLTFVMEENFPLKSLESAGVPNGPLIELRGREAGSALSAETAAQTVDYWKGVSGQLGGQGSLSTESRQSYGQLALAQANLLATSGQPGAAEQTYRIASELDPANVKIVAGLARVMVTGGRVDEASRLFDAFQKANPGQVDSVLGIRKALALPPPPGG